MAKSAPLELPPVMIDVAAAGRLLGISRSSAYRLAREGELPTVRIGPFLRVRLTDLQQIGRRAGDS